MRQIKSLESARKWSTHLSHTEAYALWCLSKSRLKKGTQDADFESLNEGLGRKAGHFFEHRLSIAYQWS